MLHPTIYNTSEVCYQYGVRHAVMSPGSRNAPLTLSFARNEKIKKWIIPDERSAGFIALGIAQEVNQPVVLCCTSGTAVLNYAPAVAEAYYRQIPLIVLSADRPPELIDQRDGQTIRQFEVLKNHCKLSIQLSIISSEPSVYTERLSDGIKYSISEPPGPVHINIPFREPFYPDTSSSLTFSLAAKKWKPPTRSNVENPMLPKLPKVSRILVIIGQHEPDSSLIELVNQLAATIPIVKSPLNNLQAGIDVVDAFIDNQQELVPELLITSGLSVLSKKLKLFLRRNNIKHHFHFDENGIYVDTYQSAPSLIHESIASYLKAIQETDIEPTYFNAWYTYQKQAIRGIDGFIAKSTYSEVKCAYSIFKSTPTDVVLHLSNSMPVRYADLFGHLINQLCRSNRGTSGIDGCTSTTVGNALVSDKINLLLTGDLAFLYDRNAFFHNYNVPNLRIIVLNNMGGGIFRLIEGPSSLPELETYFETRHHKTAEYICMENQIDYCKVNSEEDLADALNGFFDPSDSCKLIEVFTNPEVNQKEYKNLRNYINEQINKLDPGS